MRDPEYIRQRLTAQLNEYARQTNPRPASWPTPPALLTHDPGLVLIVLIAPQDLGYPRQAEIRIEVRHSEHATRAYVDLADLTLDGRETNRIGETLRWAAEIIKIANSRRDGVPYSLREKMPAYLATAQRHAKARGPEEADA